jgi:hypothetical protein
MPQDFDADIAKVQADIAKIQGELEVLQANIIAGAISFAVEWIPREATNIVGKNADLSVRLEADGRLAAMKKKVDEMILSFPQQGAIVFAQPHWWKADIWRSPVYSLAMPVDHALRTALIPLQTIFEEYEYSQKATFRSQSGQLESPQKYQGSIDIKWSHEIKRAMVEFQEKHIQVERLQNKITKLQAEKKAAQITDVWKKL